MAAKPEIRNIVAAIVRRGSDILLVHQQAPDDVTPAWALPGGRVEAGELFSEALAREVLEETGLQVVSEARLLYVCQMDNPAAGRAWSVGDTQPGSQSVAFIFAVDECAGEIACADPDELVSEAAFVPLPEALARLSQLPPAMGEPTLAWLRGEAPVGTVWCYRRQPDGQDRLVNRLGFKETNND
jgi:ADP-ribose pyrophosphatase YjhB (NUDIX family)